MTVGVASLVMLSVVDAPESEEVARSSAVGAAAVVSTVTARVEEPRGGFADRVGLDGLRLLTPSARSVAVMDQAEPVTVAVPRASPASTLPLLLASRNRVTSAPLTPVPLIRVLLLVSLSVAVPVEPAPAVSV